jgi:hypothetical protein
MWEQCSKWKFRSAGKFLKSETKIHRQKNRKGYMAIVGLYAAGVAACASRKIPLIMFGTKC